jgi:hypothetical protein
LSRSYHVDVARHAADAEARWVDNLVSRFAIPGIDSEGQGTSRRISSLGIYHVALVSRLVRALGIALEPASALATRLMATPAGDPILVMGELELRFDRAAFVASVDARIAEAVESVVPPKRGRPPRDR